MKPNNEVNAFLDIINVYFHPEESLEPSLFQKVNWKKFEKSLEFHAIRPIVYEVLKASNIEVPQNVLSNLETFTTKQAVAHLSNSIELKRLQQIFKSESIEMVPFKGVIYQDALYDKGLREAGDIDILIAKKDLENTLNLLLKEDYQYSLEVKESTIEVTENLIKAREQYEIPFNKGNHHIDLHWGIHYGFLPYTVPEDFILSLENDSEVIFWTMLNHHGAKEFWLRLKGMIDFGLFISKYQEKLNWETILSQAKDFKMRTVLLNGFYILKNLYKIAIPKLIEEQLKSHKYKAYDRSIQYWNQGKPWSNPLERFNYENILIQSQDKGFQTSTYYKHVYHAFTKPNPIDQHRFYTFPERFHFLNFLSKVFSYLIKKTFGIK